MSPTHTVPFLKRVLGQLPGAPEIIERVGFAGAPPAGGYRLPELEAQLGGWVERVQNAPESGLAIERKHVVLIGYLSWWIENTVSLALLLATQGHRVQLIHLPYRHWWTERAEFDVRRQRAYLRGLMAELRPIVEPVDLLGRSSVPIPTELERLFEDQSLLDVQYTLQREDVSKTDPAAGGELYQLRLGRNRVAGARAFGLLKEESPDVVVIPNGTILEFGALHRVAKWLDLPVTTYDFGEQRDRVWLAQNEEVMRLGTDDLWQERGDAPLTPSERQELDKLYQARQGGEVWKTFARQWQAGSSRGAQEASVRLGLEAEKPIVLLCTNVVGDSLALDRQVFTRGMADWLVATVKHLAARSDVQLVVRVHPGELLGAGHPSQEIVAGSVPTLPDSVKVIPPDSDVNTYDLMDLAHVGLVYTTTVGMEMAMKGIPVIVAGDAHYRGKGFTIDPQSMDEYLRALDRSLEREFREPIDSSRIELARRYAYRFFFEYPFAYPWHVIRFWDDMEQRPFAWVLEEAFDRYRQTLQTMVGEPIRWDRRHLGSRLEWAAQ